MPYPSVYYVDRTTDTPADTLLAFGLADLLSHLIPEGEDWGLAIESAGSGYKIQLRSAIPASWIDDCKFFFLLRALRTGKKEPNLPQEQVIDYVEHQKRNEEFRKALEKGATRQTLVEQGIGAPHPDWSTWAVIRHMRADGAFNDLVMSWNAHRQCFPSLLQLILRYYAVQPNPTEEIKDIWVELAATHNISVKAQVPALQITNPSKVKGSNNTKASGISIGGETGFWLDEYLRYVGLHQAAIQRMVRASKDNKKDRKTYIVRPHNLLWQTHKRVFAAFRESLPRQSAIKMDVLATLRYCNIFVEQWRDGLSSGRFVLQRGGRPGDYVAAIEVATYKDMGSAYAPINLSVVALPQWLPQVESREQATAFLALVDEHIKIVGSLDEKKGDETEFLQHYRNFLSSGDLNHFFRFTLGYSHILMNRIKAKAYSPQYTISNLEVLLMAHDKKLSDILQKRGFQRIASAIRQSTVIPQRAKANRGNPDRRGPDNPYEVRYGLGAELMRQAAYPEKFVLALSKFLFAFRQENVQVFERFKGAPPIHRVEVTEDDIKQVMALIYDTDYGSETVASLLVACGYASKGKPLEGVALPSGENDVNEAEFDFESDDEGEGE